MMRKFLSFLIVSCLVLASVSPACKFISGKSLMEICGADGSIQTAPMPEELAAFLPDQPEEPSHKQISSDDCTFCFTQSHLDKLSTAPAEILSGNLETESVQTLKAIAARAAHRLYQSRAPPALFS